MMIEGLKKMLQTKKNIVFAYLYGSRAKGTSRPDSDIDIAIYLSEKMTTDEYLDLKMELSEDLTKDVDLILLNEASPLLKFEVYQNHKVIFSKDKDAETSFKVKTIFEYNDFKKYIDYSHKKRINRIKKGVSSLG